MTALAQHSFRSSATSGRREHCHGGQSGFAFLQPSKAADLPPSRQPGFGVSPTAARSAHEETERNRIEAERIENLRSHLRATKVYPNDWLRVPYVCGYCGKTTDFADAILTIVGTGECVCRPCFPRWSSFMGAKSPIIPPRIERPLAIVREYFLRADNWKFQEVKK